MHTSELKALLRRVQHELDAMPAVDASLAGPLAALEDSVQKAVRKVSLTESDANDLTEQTLALEARLEADHPMLVHSMRQMMDSLGKMGI
jgi:Domain of unknown function (DUF4404)